MKTPVIFYTASYLNHEPAQTGITETIAVFPNSSNEHYQNGLLTSYAHVGQHTPISLDFIEQYCTKITDPKEYSELLEELKGQGYDDLDVLNIPKSILEQNYTSCLNFVEENNIQNEAIILFGEDWLMIAVLKCFDEIEHHNSLSHILNDALLETNIDSLYKAVLFTIIYLNYHSEKTKDWVIYDKWNDHIIRFETDGEIVIFGEKNEADLDCRGNETVILVKDLDFHNQKLVINQIIKNI